MLHDDDWYNADHRSLARNSAALSKAAGGVLVAAQDGVLIDGWIFEQGKARQIAMGAVATLFKMLDGALARLVHVTRSPAADAGHSAERGRKVVRQEIQLPTFESGGMRLLLPPLKVP